MCYLSIINMQGADSDSDDDMAFSSPSPGSSAHGSAGGGFQKIAVKRDTETGEITGWGEFYAMARMENPSLQAEESKHTAMLN